MKASKSYPVYTAIAVSSDGTKYPLKNVTTDLLISEPKNELAKKVTLKAKNVKTSNGYLSECIGMKQMRLYVTANDGEKNEEVCSGYVWRVAYESDTEKILTITAYDNLYYLQKSKDCIYFSADKTTDAIFSYICNRWGINLSYSYDKIKHPKLPLNNKYISDMLIEVLEAVRKQKGTKYVIRSESDVMKVTKEGTNTEVYSFQAKKNVIKTKGEISKEDMVTKVIIVGNEDDDERRSVEATVTGNTSEYGTLQDVVTMSSNTTVAEAKTEANEILEEKGKPTQTESAELPDVPWVHKGDLINLSTDDLKGNYIVKDVMHDALNKTMSVEVEKAS